MLFGFISQRVSGVREVYLSTGSFTSLVGSSYKLPGRGGGTPYDGLYGQAPPERGIFFKLQVYERGEISLGEVYKRPGKSVIWVCERAQRAEQMNFLALKSQENVLFLWLIPV